ncbi:MAG: hypothetical protein ACRDUV_07470 [Pseudonocardiaceae bacterium]
MTRSERAVRLLNSLDHGTASIEAVRLPDTCKIYARYGIDLNTVSELRF